MTVEELRIFINAIANKDQTGNAMTPSEYNSYLARANEDKFRFEYGLRERGPQNPIYFQSNQNSTDALRPFVSDATIIAATPTLFILPTDYIHLISAANYIGTSPRPITFVNRDEMNQIQIDPIAFPTEDYPYGTVERSQMVIYPSTIDGVYFTYLRRPTTPVWGYTIINDEAIYNPVTSTQLEWNSVYHIDIARLILAYLGINFRDSDLLTYAEQVKANGA